MTALKQKDQRLCILTIAFIILVQGIEKILMVSVEPSKTTGLALAMAYTVAFAASYYVISKTKDPFFGLLAALFGYKMMPPLVSNLDVVSPDGYMLFFIVKKLAVVLFAILVYKFYLMQEQPRNIRALTVLLLMFAVPFMNEIASQADAYFFFITKSMLYGYFAQFICYAMATIGILLVAFKSNIETMRFAAYFEFAALGINIFRQAGKVAYFIITNQHVSKSLYVWIAEYIVLIALTAVLLKLKKKEA